MLINCEGYIVQVNHPAGSSDGSTEWRDMPHYRFKSFNHACKAMYGLVNDNGLSVYNVRVIGIFVPNEAVEEKS